MMSDGNTSREAEDDEGMTVGLLKDDPRTYRVPMDVANWPRIQNPETVYYEVEAENAEYAEELAKREAESKYDLVWGAPFGEWRDLARREWSSGRAKSPTMVELRRQGGVKG